MLSLKQTETKNQNKKQTKEEGKRQRALKVIDQLRTLHEQCETYNTSLTVPLELINNELYFTVYLYHDTKLRNIISVS